MDQETYNCLLMSFKQLREELKRLKVPNISKYKTKKEMCQKLISIGWKPPSNYELPERYKSNMDEGVTTTQVHTNTGEEVTTSELSTNISPYELLMIDTLPDELILNICEKMDVKTLSNFIKTNSRIHQVCDNLLQSKKPEYEIEKIISDLMTSDKVTYQKIEDNLEINVVIKRYGPNDYSVSQLISIKNKVSRGTHLPSPIINSKRYYNAIPYPTEMYGYLTLKRQYDHLTKDIFPELAQNLVKQGYKLVSKYKL